MLAAGRELITFSEIEANGDLPFTNPLLYSAFCSKFGSTAEWEPTLQRLSYAAWSGWSEAPSLYLFEMQMRE
jgi:hypothetical protein